MESNIFFKLINNTVEVVLCTSSFFLIETLTVSCKSVGTISSRCHGRRYTKKI